MPPLSGKRFLVIGGAGLIGSHTVDALLREDVEEVIIYDNFTRGTFENLSEALKDSRCRIFPLGGDILHRDLLTEAMKEINGVFHFAALWLLHCHEFPRSAFEVNISGTFNILEAAITSGIKRIVYSSSASVYGDAVSEPMNENHPYNNLTFYGATKIAGEHMYRSLHHRYKETPKRFDYVGLRYMNVYGPRQDYQGAYIAVIMKILDRLDNGLPPIVYGNGSQAYDFIYVEDCAQANVCAMKSDATDRFYNVGTGQKTTIKELTEQILSITGSNQQIQFEPVGQTFVKNRVGCPEKAREEIDFNASTSLKEGLVKLIAWRNEHKEELNRKRQKVTSQGGACPPLLRSYKNCLFLGLILVLFLSGCGSRARLTFMVGGAPNEISYWEGILRDFSDKNGVSIEMIRQSTDTDQRKQGILLALRGRKADPDILLLDVAWIGQMAASNWLEPLNDHGVITEPFFPSIIKLADTYQSNIIGLPLYVDGGMLYYRKDLLAAAGFPAPPKTWEELVDMSLKVQESVRQQNSDFWGFVWQGAQYEGLICNALEFFSSANGGFFDSAQKPQFNNGANQTALKLMVDLIQTHKISPPNTFTDMKEEEVRLMFHNGNALFERNWPYAWGLHNADDSPIKGKVGMAPLPCFSQGKSASTLGGWHIAVSRFSDKKPEAVKFVQYVTSFEVQKALSLKLGWNPGRIDVYDDTEIRAQNPAMQDLKGIFVNAVPRPIVPYYSGVSQILQKHINAALAGHVSAETALNNAQNEVEGILKEYGI